MGNKNHARIAGRTQRHWLVWLIYGCAVLSVLTAVIPRPNDYFSTVLWKTTAFQALVEVMFAAWFLLMVADRSYRPRFGTTAVALLVLAAAMLLSLPFSIDPLVSFWSLTNRMAGVAAALHLVAWFLVLSSVLRRREEWVLLFSVSTLAAFGTALVAITRWINEAMNVHIDTQFGNSSYLTSYLLVHVFVALYLWTQANTSFRRRLWLVVTAALSFTVVIAASRAGILSLVCGLGLTAFWLVMVSSISRRKKAAVCVLPMLFVLLSFSAFFALRTEYMRSWVQAGGKLPSFASRIAFRTFGEDRLVSWDMALKGIAERPWFGWGNEQFYQVAGKYLDPNGPALDVFNESWQTKAHNQYLDTLIAYGFVGFAAYVGLLIAAAVTLRRYYRAQEPGASRRGAAVVIVFFLCYLGYSFFFFDTPQQMMVVFMVLAMAANIEGERGTRLRQGFGGQEGGEGERNQGNDAVRMEIRPVSKPLAAAVGVMCLVLVWFVNIQPLIAASYYAEAVKAMVTDWDLAAKKFEKSYSLSPNPFSYEMLFHSAQAVRPYIDYYQQGGQFDDQAERLVRVVAAGAAEASRRHPHSLLAMLEAGDTQRMLSAFDSAALGRAEEYATKYLQLAPNRFDGHMLMAELSILRNDLDGALRWLDSTDRLHYRMNIMYGGYINYRRACVYARQREFQKMADALGKANPFPVTKDARLIKDFGSVVRAEDDLSGFEPYLDAVMTQFQNQADVLLVGARIYHVLGHDDMVQQVFDAPSVVQYSQTDQGRVEIKKLKAEIEP